jgi:hypothetical protein
MCVCEREREREKERERERQRERERAFIASGLIQSKHYFLNGLSSNN